MAKRNRTDERRAFRRWPVAIAGQGYGTWGSSHLLITELSEAGLNLTWGRRSIPGDEIVIAWRLEDGPPLQATCAVRCASQQSAGVEFLDITRADRLRIVAYFMNTLRSQ